MPYFLGEKKHIFEKICSKSIPKSKILNIFIDINLSAFTEDMWQHFAADEQPEPEFKEKLIETFNTCYQLSRKIPQSLLNKKGPMYKQFGRQKMFFKCCHVSHIS